MTTKELEVLEAVAQACDRRHEPGVSARTAGLDGSRSRQLGQLAERGHLKRSEGDADGHGRRVKLYAPTAKGRRILAA